jgi:hypothetical protein
MKDIITRYKPLNETRKHKRYIPTKYDNFNFICQHPKSLALIPGKVLDISIEGLEFKPKSKEKIDGILYGNLLSPCTLRVGHGLFSLACSVVGTSDYLHLLFREPDPEMLSFLKKYFIGKAERELLARSENT